MTTDYFWSTGAMVNFSCPLCSKLMGVGPELLGKRVRCPHCQQVISAPAEGAMEAMPVQAVGPEMAPIMTFQVAPPDRDEDSIFASPDAGDDVFSTPAAAIVELPPEPPYPDLQAPAAISEGTLPMDMPPEPESEPLAQQLGTIAYVPDQSDATLPAPPTMAGPSEPAIAAPEPWTSPDPEATELASQTASSTRLRDQVQPQSILPVLVLIFLVPYAILSTAVAIYLYYGKKEPPSPLEMMPDWPGDHPGASRNQSNVRVIERVNPEAPLPARLKVPLGQSLRVGDLEVTPLAVTQRTVAFCNENTTHNPEPSRSDSLVLNLKLKNISEDVTFVPTDPAFFRQWKPGALKPYTLLEVGDRRFFGGACEWSPRGPAAPGRGDPREYIEGQENGFKKLKPGQEVTTLVCTDPYDAEVLRTIRAYDGPITWRVHLRRGLVKLKDREVAASAVVGVIFERKDIH